MEALREIVTRRAYRMNMAPLATSRAWCEIDLSALKENAQELKQRLPVTCRLMAAVKGNAYGHGDAEVAKALNRVGIQDFAVASLEEGIRLRQNGIKGDILILGYTYPLNVQRLVHFDLIQTVVDRSYGEILDSCGLPVRVHVKIDTGMHRLGTDYDNEENLRAIYGLKNLRIEGTYSHLCVSDSLDEEDVAFTREQIRRFQQALSRIRQWGFDPGFTHIQSSYGFLNYPELQFDFARIGIALYGNLSGFSEKTRLSTSFLTPVLSLRSRISMIRDLEDGESVGYGRSFVVKGRPRIGVVTIGYGDGIPRSLSFGRGGSEGETGSDRQKRNVRIQKRGYVLLKGKKAPIVGRICMDQMMIDVTGICDASPGDIVTLIGEDGDAVISAEEMADWSGTITNELLCRIGHRVNRVYIE